MKKTLIALAVLAASSASFAQVTITGAFQTGYQTVTDGKATTAGTTTDRSGLGVYKSEVYFNVKEDLGAGYKLDLRYGLGGLDRSGESNYGATGANGPATGRDANMDLATPFGVISLSTTKLADYLYATAGLGVAIDDLSDVANKDKLLLGRTRRDGASFTLPLGPIGLTLAHYEAAGAGLGLGVGAAGSTLQRYDLLGASYAGGPLAGNVQYLSYDNRNGMATNKDQIRLGGSYDLGMAKVGLAYQVVNYESGKDISGKERTPKVTQYLLGASVPVGPISVGLNYAKRTNDDFGAAGLYKDGDQAGYLLGAKYSLSKRTSLDFQYSNFEAAVNAVDRSENMYLLMSHKF